MGYQSIDNLYKNRDVLLFRRCFALEKVHGSSAHLSFSKTEGKVTIHYFAGGESHERFISIFNEAKLLDAFLASGHQYLTIYGEVYGGKCQGMRETYGERLAFIAFEVSVGDGDSSIWLSVPQAFDVATSFGLEFVDFEEGPTDLEWLDAQRDRPSRLAKRRGILEDKPSEGIVIRPPIEVTKNNGKRITAKHKTAKFGETKTPRQVDAATLQVLSNADKVADEWVTTMRLEHVLQKLAAEGNPALEISDIRRVTPAMLEDVKKESVGEIVWSKEVEKAIKSRAADMYKIRVTTVRTD